MEGEIRLSSAEFRALASETRAGIIKLLQQRNHTLTELSKKLSLAAPTIKQHLGVLENVELIQGLDEGRKWKYYSLTRKGKNIFSQETPISVLVVLGASIIALCGLVYSFLAMLESKAMIFAESQLPAAVPLIAEAGKASAGAVPAVQEAAKAQWLLPDMQVTALLFGMVALSLLIGLLIAKVRK